MKNLLEKMKRTSWVLTSATAHVRGIGVASTSMQRAAVVEVRPILTSTATFQIVSMINDTIWQAVNKVPALASGIDFIFVEIEIYGLDVEETFGLYIYGRDLAPQNLKKEIQGETKLIQGKIKRILRALP